MSHDQKRNVAWEQQHVSNGYSVQERKIEGKIKKKNIVDKSVATFNNQLLPIIFIYCCGVLCNNFYMKIKHKKKEGIRSIR